ncbi:hypothetical protein [Mycobacterium mantenii]|uniref:Alanine and proline rich protein n=1 Tax=Mycobacterium mantenii TaxID=560555 RepID=A0A1A2TLR7_MYCNT|nr:hypothetical protein [Mycobacterium mantenii]OBH44671.1 hypothetical protein A5688_08765 [Mycobacterium mantenii]OBH77305.1 hypothetical protein A5683_18925 [Mycobacterium mantenii]
MADRLDVAARLEEGRVAVEHTQTYVQACQVLGYQNPDLTTHPAQIREWYAGEDGLDLRALDRDCAELRASGVVAAEALRMQRAQVAELAAAWTGPGGDAAVQLLQRHCETADALATELRAAAQRCESLRDNLWYLIDSEVATAIAVDDRVAAARPAWLAAAAAVMAGDRDRAAEVVRQQVMPYVDNAIRHDWLTAMRSTSDGVETSYAMVIDKMAAVPTARFEFPGDLGAGVVPMQLAPPATAPEPTVNSAPEPPVDPAPTLTAAAPGPVSAIPDPVTPAPSPVAAAPPADWGSALGDGLGMPAGDLGGFGGSGLGGGLGGGGGLLGLAGRIVDAVGGLIGSAGDGLGGADPVTGDGGDFDENPFHTDDSEDSAENAGDKAGDGPDDPATTDDAATTDGPATTDQPVGEPEPNQPDESIQPVGAPAPVNAPPADPPPLAPPASPAAAPAPAAGQGSTPCEIAADQLPQAGQ